MCKGMNSTDLFDPDWTKPHSYQVDFYQFSLPPSPKFPFCLSVFHTCPLCSHCNKDSSEYCLDKEPRLSISIVIWILSSDTICQLNQFHTNGEAATLSNTDGRLNAAHDMDEFQIRDQSKVFLNFEDIKIDNLNFDMTHFTREGSFVMNSCLVYDEIDFLCKSLCTLIAKEIHLVQMMITDQIQSNYDALTFTF